MQDQGEYVLSNRMTVTKNILSSAASGMITYICTARYNNLEAVGKITFCRVDHGKDADSSQDPVLLNTLALDASRSETILSQNISGFNYIEIYYHTISNHYDSIRIRHMGRSSISTLIHLPVYDEGVMYRYQAELSLSDTAAVMPLDKHIRYNTTDNTVESASDLTAFISVDAIYGIK